MGSKEVQYRRYSTGELSIQTKKKKEGRDRRIDDPQPEETEKPRGILQGGSKEQGPSVRGKRDQT